MPALTAMLAPAGATASGPFLPAGLASATPATIKQSRPSPGDHGQNEAHNRQGHGPREDILKMPFRKALDPYAGIEQSREEE